MHIAIIGSRGYPYVYSGYETLVKELSEGLIARGHQVTVYCHKGLFEKRPKSVNGVNLVYLPTIEKKSLSQLVHSFFAFSHAIFRRYDVIFAVNSANGPFGLITKLLGRKTAINVDGLEWLRPKWKGLGARYFFLASYFATKLYDVVVSDSDEMQKIYKKQFKADSTVIAYGAHIRESKQPDRIEKWGLAQNGYYLIVGRLIPDNNADIIVREFVASSSKKKLVIVGDVPYSDAYADRIKSNLDERVVFTGYVTDQDDLAELYHGSFAYFHGHEFGGTNPTLLKALAYGCGILALDTRFSREVLANGEYGLYFTKENGNLAGVIEEVEAEPEQLLGLKRISRTRIRDNYTWEKIISQYEELFTGMVGRS